MGAMLAHTVRACASADHVSAPRAVDAATALGSAGVGAVDAAARTEPEQALVFALNITKEQLARPARQYKRVLEYLSRYGVR